MYDRLFDPRIVCCLEPGVYLIMAVRGGAVGWVATELRTGRSRVRFPMLVLTFFIDVISMQLVSTRPLTEMSTSNISLGVGVKAAGV